MWATLSGGTRVQVKGRRDGWLEEREYPVLYIDKSMVLYKYTVKVNMRIFIFLNYVQE